MPTPSDQSVKSDYEDYYDYAVRDMQDFYENAEQCMLASLGDQWLSNEKSDLQKKGREALVFNYIHRIIQLISGYQRQHRLALKFRPSEPGDAPSADLYSQIIMRDMEHSSIYEVLSDAFEHGALRTGINLVMLYMNYAKDPVNGNIEALRVPHTNFVMDPNLFKRDFSDCRYIIHRTMMSRDSAIAILPEREKALRKIMPHRDSRFLKMPFIDDPKDEILQFDMFWKREHEKKKFVMTPHGEEDVTDLSRDEINRYVAEVGGQFYTRNTPVMKLYILVEEEVLWKGDEPWGIGDFPYVPIWGLWTPECTDWKYKLMPLSALMRDPQRELNKRRSQMIDVIENNINSGTWYEKGAIKDPRLLYLTGQGAHIPFEDGALTENRVRERTPVQVPPSWLQIDELFTQAIMEIPGANSEMLGLIERDNVEISGILAKLRQASGLTVLQPIFDAYRFSKARLGYKLIKMVQNNYSPQKVANITGVQQLPPNFYEVSASENDVVATEGVLSDTQRQEHWHELLMLKQMGAPIPWTTLIRNAPVHFKQELVRDIEMEAQKEQEMMQQQMKNEQLTQQMMQARAASDMGASRMKLAAEQENISDAQLNRIRMISEMNDMRGQDYRKAQMDVLEALERVEKIKQMRQQPQLRQGGQ